MEHSIGRFLLMTLFVVIFGYPIFYFIKRGCLVAKHSRWLPALGNFVVAAIITVAFYLFTIYTPFNVAYGGHNSVFSQFFYMWLNTVIVGGAIGVYIIFTLKWIRKSNWKQALFNSIVVVIMTIAFYFMSLNMPYERLFLI